MKHWMFVLIITLATVFFGCSDDKDKDKDKPKGVFYFEPSSGVTAGTLRVVDENQQPVEAASILLGKTIDNPFKDNIIITDENGEASIPKAWLNALPITIEAPGFIKASYLEVEPVAQAFQISSEDGKDTIQVSGDTIDYGRLRQDGYVDFSLVIPALTQRSLMSFDIGALIRPVSDSLNIAGRSFEIPSNISLPYQKESYIIPITIDKPAYRMFVNKPGFYKFFATHGRFPLKKVVDEMRKDKSIFEVINNFEFMGGGQKDLQVNKSVAGQSISVKQIAFDQMIQVQAPTLSPQHEMLSLSLVNQGGHYFPSDLKRLTSQSTVELKHPSTQVENHVLSILLNRDVVTNTPIQMVESFMATEIINIHPLFQLSPIDTSEQLRPFSTQKGQLSIAFGQPRQGQPISFLPMIQAPQIQKDKILLDAPLQNGSVIPLATYVVFSEIQSNGSVQSEKRSRMWEVYTTGWQKMLDLPHVQLSIDPNKKYRWEVLFLGRDPSAATNAGGLLDGITHVSRNSIDI